MRWGIEINMMIMLILINFKGFDPLMKLKEIKKKFSLVYWFDNK